MQLMSRQDSLVNNLGLYGQDDQVCLPAVSYVTHQRALAQCLTAAVYLQAK
jgi:hypothetical protein